MEPLEARAVPRTAHTLFLDFVGYSRLATDGQMAAQQELQQLVSASAAVQGAGGSARLRRTGDGLFIVFEQSAEDPVRCAVEIDAAIRRQAPRLRERIGAPFRVRMGIHTGPVAVFEDEAGLELAGDGINTAQRTMDCGDDGHILVSGAAVAALGHVEPWTRWLRDLGVCRVKHDELVHLWNLAHSGDPEIGNEAVPRHVFASQENARRLAERDLLLAREERREGAVGLAWRAIGLGIGVAAVAGAAFLLYTRSTGAAADVARFTRKVGVAARERRKAAATPTSPVAADPIPDPGRSVDAMVPDLKGKSLDEARAAAEAAGLRLVNETQLESTPAHRVVEQSPAPGRGLVAGGVVRVRLEPAPTPPAPSGPGSTSNGPSGAPVEAQPMSEPQIPPTPHGGSAGNPDSAPGQTPDR
ncbi:MAG: PASTA domain-containing protein [Armatimonadota bacterium]